MSISDGAALAALAISLVSFFQSRKALKISTFSYKKEVAPELIVSYQVTLNLSFDDRVVYFRLQNKNYGIATITKVTGSGHFRPIIEFAGSKKLGLNGKLDFNSIPNPMVYPIEHINQRREMPGFLQELEAEINRVVTMSFFVVEFKDQLGNKFNVTLKYSAEKNHFTGDVVEFIEQD